MSDDESHAEQTMEVTHEDGSAKEPREIHTKTWSAQTIPPPFKNYGDHIRRLRERNDMVHEGAVEDPHLHAFCAKFAWVDSKNKQSQKGATILLGEPRDDRERDALCQYLYDKHRNLWLRHVVAWEEPGVVGRMRFRIGDDFIQLWMAVRDWDKQFPEPKRHMWFCHGIRLMARYQAYYAFGIINWWMGKNTAECRAKHRARPLPPGSSPDCDIAMVLFCKDCEKKSLPPCDYRSPFMNGDPIPEALARMPSNMGWGGDAIDDDDAAASDGATREESNFDEGEDGDGDEDVEETFEARDEPASRMSSTGASDDDDDDYKERPQKRAKPNNLTAAQNVMWADAEKELERAHEKIEFLVEEAAEAERWRDTVREARQKHVRLLREQKTVLRKGSKVNVSREKSTAVADFVQYVYEHVDPDNKMPLRYALACINKEATLTFGEQSMNPDVCGGAARYKDGELPRRIVLLVEAKAKSDLTSQAKATGQILNYTCAMKYALVKQDYEIHTFVVYADKPSDDLLDLHVSTTPKETIFWTTMTDKEKEMACRDLAEALKEDAVRGCDNRDIFK